MGDPVLSALEVEGGTAVESDSPVAELVLIAERVLHRASSLERGIRDLRAMADDGLKTEPMLALACLRLAVNVAGDLGWSQPEMCELALNWGTTAAEIAPAVSVEAFSLARTAAIDDLSAARAAAGLARALVRTGQGTQAAAVLTDGYTAVVGPGEATDILAGADVFVHAFSTAAGRNTPFSPPGTAVDHVRPNRSLRLLSAIVRRALAGADPGRVEEDVAEACLGVDRVVDISGTLAPLTGLAGTALLAADLIHRAGPAFEVELMHCQAPRYAAERAIALSHRAVYRLRLGELVGAAADAEESLHLAAACLGSAALVPLAVAVQFAVCFERGGQPGWILLGDDADVEVSSHLLLTWVRAEVQRHAGHDRPAVRLYQSYGKGIGDVGNAGLLWPWRSRLAAVLHRLGDQAEADRLVHEEIDLARDARHTHALGVALHTAALFSPRDRQEPELRMALESLPASTSALERAKALTSLGEVVAENHDAVAARSILFDAHTMAQSCGATLLLARITGNLARLGVSMLPGPGPGCGEPADLTQAQQLVTSYAAAGFSNRQIASRMVLSVKTVESHLYASYRKLGISRRGELRDVLPPYPIS